MKLLAVLFIVVLAAALWVRLSPSDVDKWHKPIDNPRDKDFAAGAIRVIEGGGFSVRAFG